MCKALVSTLGMSREDWLNERKKGLGGSDASVVLGLNKWKSRMALFLEKTGQIEDQPAGERAYWGTILEDVVANEFIKRTGKKVFRRNFIFQDSEYPFLIANIDREVVGENTGLECKTTAEFNADQWVGDLVPDSYYCQCQHYCRVMNWDGIYIAVLVGLKEFLWKYIPRDNEFIALMVEREVDFWQNHIETGNPPEWDGTDSSDEVLKILHPEAKELMIILPEDQTNDLATEYNKLCEEIKKLETLRDSYKQQLQALLGDAAKGESLSWQVTWSNVTSNRFDSKSFQKDNPDLYKKYITQSTYRRFGLKQIKGEE